MKKVISVFLAALMLMSCFAVASFAAPVCDCGIGDHKTTGYCTCCPFCPNVDHSYILDCVDLETGEMCCDKCSGMATGDCGCDCSTCTTGSSENYKPEDIITPEQQENFIDAFQQFIKKISDFFDELFDKIFEFLKIDDVIGKGDELPTEGK